MLIELSPPTIVAEGTHLQGNLAFSSRVQILGLVEGEIHQTGKEDLIVGKTGWVQGSIASQGAIIIAGRVDGDINSLSSIRLLATSKVNGRLKSPKIQVDPGASLEAEVSMQWVTANKTEQPLAA